MGVLFIRFNFVQGQAFSPTSLRGLGSKSRKPARRVGLIALRAVNSKSGRPEDIRRPVLRSSLSERSVDPACGATEDGKLNDIPNQFFLDSLIWSPFIAFSIRPFRAGSSLQSAAAF